MQLAELFKDWPCTVKGSIRTEIGRVEDDARRIQQGDLFVARQGRHADGATYIEQAIGKGASVVVVEDELLFDSLVVDVPLIWVPNVQKFLAYASAKVHGFPSEVLKIIAITGTNGKTTVSHFVSQLLQHFQQNVMVIGTNGVFVQGERIDFGTEALTTLQAKELQAILKWAVLQNVDAVIMEASSMGLATHRLDYCAIDVGVYLNLAEDHIEDHGTFEQYKLAKQHLVSLSDKLVLNGDDTFCRTVGVLTKKRKYYFGTGNHVDVQVQLLNEGNHSTDCCIQMKDTQQVVTLPVGGDFQLMNVLAAMTTVHALGFPFEEIGEAACTVTLPAGRMEYMANDLGISIIIDYAHTAEAMRVVLQALHKQKVGKIIAVFSCGGERDVAKRAQMGLAASTYADIIYLTTDNPRSESPLAINADIQEGFLLNQVYVTQLDRRKAIEQALQQAERDDIVIIIGKGHEQTQTIGQQTSAFSDRACVEQFLAEAKKEQKY